MKLLVYLAIIAILLVAVVIFVLQQCGWVTPGRVASLIRIPYNYNICRMNSNLHLIIEESGESGYSWHKWRRTKHYYLFWKHIYNNKDGKVDGRVKYRAPVVLINHLGMDHGCSTVVLSKSVGCVGNVRYTPHLGTPCILHFRTKGTFLVKN